MLIASQGECCGSIHQLLVVSGEFPSINYRVQESKGVCIDNSFMIVALKFVGLVIGKG